MKKIMLVATLLIFLPGVVFAQNINYFGIENTVLNNNYVNTKIDITFSYPNEDRFTLPVYASISNFNYTSNFGADCFLENRTYGVDIFCSLFGLSNDTRSLSINYTSSSFVIRSGSQYIYTNDISMPFDVLKFFYQIALPPGTGLVKNASLISPSGWDTATDGRNIFLFWNKDNLSAGQVFSADVVYEPVSIITGLLLGPQAQILILGGVIGSVLLVFFFWKRKSMLKVVFPILKDDEKRIFESLMKHGSGINQRLIVKESNYSKAKVSKVLKSLEQRGLLKLERIGRSNKVHMVKKITEKPLNEPGNNQET